MNLSNCIRYKYWNCILHDLPETIEELNLSHNVGEIYHYDYSKCFRKKRLPNLKILNLQNNPNLKKSFVDNIKKMRPELIVLSDFDVKENETKAEGDTPMLEQEGKI